MSYSNKQLTEMKDWIGTTKIELDKLGRATKIIDHEGKTITYELNKYGQREKIVYPNNLEVNYEYENLLLKKVSHGIHPAEETTYNYDNLGRMTEKTTGELVTKYEFTNEAEYFYDATNMIAKAITPKGEATYTYNGFRNRVKRNNQTYTIDITKPYNNLLMLDEQNFIWGNGLISTTNAKNNYYPARKTQAYRYMHDHLGSPIRLLNHWDRINSMSSEADHLFNGVTLSYDEFGQPQGENNYFANPFGFTGYMPDDISDTFFAQAREYIPQIGRFTAEDRHWNVRNMIYGDELDNIIPDWLAILQSNNLYGYTMNNPLKFIDPLGLCSDDTGDERSWFIRQIESLGTVEGLWNAYY